MQWLSMYCQVTFKDIVATIIVEMLPSDKTYEYTNNNRNPDKLYRLTSKIVKTLKRHKEKMLGKEEEA